MSTVLRGAVIRRAEFEGSSKARQKLVNGVTSGYVRRVNVPIEAMCGKCGHSAPVVSSQPTWSAGSDRVTRWFLDVDCADCGRQYGWLSDK